MKDKGWLKTVGTNMAQTTAFLLLGPLFIMYFVISEGASKYAKYGWLRLVAIFGTPWIVILWLVAGRVYALFYLFVVLVGVILALKKEADQRTSKHNSRKAL